MESANFAGKEIDLSHVVPRLRARWILRAEFGIHTKEQEEKTKQNRKSHFTTFILVKSDTAKKVVLQKHSFEERIKNYLTHFERLKYPMLE